MLYTGAPLLAGPLLSLPWVKYNYDTIAFVYDRVARLVFGHTLIDAQQYLVEAIPPGARVLIVGGGTGWILETIATYHPSGLHITYIDSSEKMIGLARRRNAGNNVVDFLSADIQEVTLVDSYDVVFTAFFFDNFEQQGAEAIFNKLHTALAPGGHWLYADFQNTIAPAHKVLLRIMYMFFRLLCRIQARVLPDMQGCFGKHRYTRTGLRTFRKNWIAAEIYHKQ